MIESDSIIDEVPNVLSSDKRSDQDSIIDEVPYAKPDSDKESEIEEDSFLKDEYEKDNFKVSNAKKELEARNRNRFNIPTGKDEAKTKLLVKDAEFKLGSEVQKSNLVGGLLSEMMAYEKATLSQVMLDRMEKICVSSLAQKD